MPRSDISFPQKDAELREDVHMLGALVGEVIREQGGDALFEAVENNRQAAIARREGDAEAGRQLAERTRNVPPAQARDLVRAFSTWFEMVNMAEKVHRIRRRRQYINEGKTQPGGIHRSHHQAQGAGADARRRAAADAADVDRAGVHRASHRIHPSHHPAQATEDRQAAAGTVGARRQHRGRDARHLGPDSQRNHFRLADGREFARTPDRRR